MTIKEMEDILDIPRATIRFYEKEGLIDPKRGSNGYRDYSKEDLEKTKKIVILRKIGLPLNDIADIFDGAKTLQQALDENLISLQKQMEELKGAMHLSEKIREKDTGINELDADSCLNYIDEEEKQGNRFMTIAKDIAETEKGVFAEWFAFTDKDGKPYDSWWKVIRNAVICLALTGVILCLFRGKWNFINFRDGALGMLIIVLVECVLSIPLYFLGKKYPWIANNRTKALFIAAGALCAILIAVDQFV